MTAHAETQHPGWSRRRLIYGDWTWLVRDPLDVLRLVFISGAIVFALEGRSTAVALTAASAVLVVARVINLPRWFDFGLIVAMTLIAYGTALSLYGGWFYYDKVVHGISPIGYVPVLYIALVRLGVVPDPAQAIHDRRVARIFGIFFVTLAVGIAVGACYESIEWFEDKFLGGHFVGGLWDTETDLLCDEGGSLVGATFLTVWALRGWTSRRRTVVAVPGPADTPVQRAAGRMRPRRAAWDEKLGGLPSAAQGLVALAAGVILLALPSPSVRTVGIIIGTGLVVYAAFELVELFRHGDPATRAGRAITVGAFGGAGTVLIAWPAITQLALLYVVGASAVAFGLAEAAALTAGSYTERQRWLGGISSVIALIFGVAMLGLPGRSLTIVIHLLALYLIVAGGLRLVRAVDAWARDRHEANTVPPVAQGEQA